MKRGYDEVLSEYGLCAYDETNQGSIMTQREEFGRAFLHSGLAYRDKLLCKALWNKGFLLGAESTKVQPQWVAVSERLPEEDGTYFCLGHGGAPFVCLFRTTKYEGKIWLRSTGTKRVDGITHWMPLPAAPEQNK